MIERLFPMQFDNSYDGHRVALWLLGLLIALKLIMSVNAIVNTAAIATGDGIPLDAYGADAARQVLRLFALTALGQLALTFVGLVALVRYRAMVPFVFLLLTLEHVARRLISQAYATAGTDGAWTAFYINMGLLALLVAGLLLSAWPSRRSDAASEILPSERQAQ